MTGIVASQKLLIYNNALQNIGERTLATLTDNRESRRQLDLSWDTGAIQWCLEQGLWNFATRSVKVDFSPSVQPTFGYKRAFDKPDDWVRTSAVCQDEFFRSPLLQYTDEASFWFSDLDTIYVRYVSNDVAYGLNMGKWPQTFQKLVSAYLSSEIVDKVTQDDAKRKDAREALKLARTDAKSKDAMDETTQFPPPGSWVQARRGRLTRWDRGTRSGNLY